MKIYRRNGHGYISAADLPPDVDALKLPPAGRLERLQRELRAASRHLQHLARQHGHRCDSPEQADELAIVVVRDGAEADLTHALTQYQRALARLKAEMQPGPRRTATRRARP